MPHYPMSDYLPGGPWSTASIAGITRHMQGDQHESTPCSSGLCQDLFFVAGSLSNMWRPPETTMRHVRPQPSWNFFEAIGATTDSHLAAPVEEEEDTETVPCANGEQCQFFTERGRHRRVASIYYMCTVCGICPTCRRQCDYSSSWVRDGMPRQCCSCLTAEHHHCDECNEWLSQDDDDMCDSCVQHEEEQHEERYAFNNTPIQHLIYNCDSCGRQVGSCTCVLAYL